MIGHAHSSMTLRAALAAAAAANKSYGPGDKSFSDLAAGFNLWSRGPSPAVTQREWIDFYSAIQRTGARAYWQIARGAGGGAAAPECCAVLAPGLVEIARVLPPQLGQAPIALPLERAIADAVLFDADGDGVEVPLANSSSSSGSSSSSRNVAALTSIDILEFGIMRLGTLCNATRPVQLPRGH